MHWSQLTKRPVAFEEEMRAPEAGAAVDAGRAREVVPPAPLPEGAAHWLLVEIRGPFTRIAAGVSEQVPPSKPRFPSNDATSTPSKEKPHLPELPEVPRQFPYLQGHRAESECHQPPRPFPDPGAALLPDTWGPAAPAPGSVRTGQAGYTHPRSGPAFPVGTLPQPLTSLTPRPSGPSSRPGQPWQPPQTGPPGGPCRGP